MVDPAEPAVPNALAAAPTRPEPLSPAEQTLAIVLEMQDTQADATRRLDDLAGDVEALKPTGAEASDAAASDERLTAVETAVKWATPWRNLAVLIAFFLVGGAGVVAATGSYAREAVIETVKEAHQGDEPLIEPSVKTVNQLQVDVGSMKGGVDCLVETRQRAKVIKGVELELELHRQQHRELIQEWTAKKAARRSAGKKPTKTDGHLALEAKLETLTTAPQKHCTEEETKP